MRKPTKAHSLKRLKALGLPIKTIIDVGVLSGTPDLMHAFPNEKHILFEPIVEWNATIEAAYANVPHELVNIAISDRIGTVTLEVQSVIPGKEISVARIADIIRPGCQGRESQTSTLDAFLGDRTEEAP